MYKALNFDFETLSQTPDSVVLDLAAVIYDIDGTDSFVDLVSDKTRTFHVKFEVEHQIKDKRKLDRDTLDWWMRQTDSVQSILKPSSDDVAVRDAILAFEKFLEANQFLPRMHNAYCRGQSFDFPIMDSLMRMYAQDLNYKAGCFPCNFWEQGDIRTALRFMLCRPDLRTFPIKKSALDGFEKHNSIHDVCKDAILMQTVYKYAMGQLEIPDDAIWV